MAFTLLDAQSTTGTTDASVPAFLGLAAGDVVIIMYLGRIVSDDPGVPATDGEFDVTAMEDGFVTGTTNCYKESGLGDSSWTFFARAIIGIIVNPGDHPSTYVVTGTPAIVDPSVETFTVAAQLTYRPDASPTGYYANIKGGACASGSSGMTSPGIAQTVLGDLSVRGFMRTASSSFSVPAGFTSQVHDSVSGNSLEGSDGTGTEGQTAVGWGAGVSINSHTWSARVYPQPENPPNPPVIDPLGQKSRRIHYPDWAFAPAPAQLDENYKALERFCRVSNAKKCNLRLRYKPNPNEQVENWYQIERWARVYVTGTDCLCGPAAIKPTSPECFLRVPHKEWATTTRDPVHERENWLAVDRWMTAITSSGCECVEEDPEEQ